jgi:enoyl-CoA hydratase
VSDDRLGVEHLHYEMRGSIAWCRVDRPAMRNALSPAMYAGLGRAVGIASTDRNCEALVITGTGDVFIPGGDLGSNDGLGVPLTHVLPWPHIRASTVPVITAVNGLCFASGLMFAMLSDIAVASERAVFRVPELALGFPDMWMASVLPQHVGVGRARELALTGRRFDAREALAMGVVERVVAHEELETAAEAAAYEILNTAPLARNLFRQAVSARYGVVDEATMNWGPESPEVAEGFAAFQEKRPPAWQQRISPDRQPSS